MPEGQVLEFTHVTKRFNEVTAVSDFSARVEPGAVTAFLGPNGAGKTTTLRILLGQVRATSGTATIGGTTYAELRQPLRTIGAVLEETVYRPRRTAERQLTIAAKANGIPLARVGEVLSLVGLEGEGDSRIGGFSLGMRQRLSVAHALLGDPGALVFDEPANGLDPEGIRWMRLLMRRLADEGRTVLVSSHVLSEVEQVADNVLVLSKGQLVLASGIETLADPKGGSVIVDAADRDALTAALSSAGFDIEVLRSGLTVRGGDAGTVGAVAADAGIALSTLVQRGPTLEDVFIDLMRGGRRGARPDTTPPLAASASTDVPRPADDVAGAPPAAADSVVAIPVAAAAAWAAEAAAAPADEEIVEDLAASVLAGTGDSDESGAAHDEAEELFAGAAEEDQTPGEDAAAQDAAAEDAPVEEAPAADAPSDTTAADDEDAPETETSADVDASVEDADDEDAPETSPGVADASDSDATPAETFDATPLGGEAPTPSFDEILFGAAAPVAAVDSAPAGEPRHSVAEIFTSPPADADEPDQAPAATEESVVVEESHDEHVAEDSHDDDDHAGVEIFADLDDSNADDDTNVDDDASDDAPEVDPRSAAVSSMLAAAARAYYEDEPKDYPLSADGQEADESAAEGAHWSVASTGVIETVPPVSAEGSADTDSTDSSDDVSREGSGADDAGSDEHASDEAASAEESPRDDGDEDPHLDREDHRGEDHDGENHDEDHHHDGGDHRHG